MNDKDRFELLTALNMLRGANTVICAIAETEQERLDAMPDNFKLCSSGEKRQVDIDLLNECVTELSTLIRSIKDHDF